jgi:peptide deformylase
MAILQIIHEPDPRLRIPSQPVVEITKKVQSFIQDMIETMKANQGIGLAAPQVAVHLQILVMQVSDDHPLRVLINPEIVGHSLEKTSYQEGCLSIPDYFASVTRSSSVQISFLDEKGVLCLEKFDDLEGICVQHEIDHLKGILFIDHLSFFKKQMITKKLSKIAAKTKIS